MAGRGNPGRQAGGLQQGGHRFVIQPGPQYTAIFDNELTKQTIYGNGEQIMLWDLKKSSGRPQHLIGRYRYDSGPTKLAYLMYR